MINKSCGKDWQKKDAEYFVSATLAARGKALKTGVCGKCGEIFYTFFNGDMCSGRCRRFIHGDNGSGYQRVTLPGGERTYQHRALVNAPAGFIVHHKNHDKSDNRLENLEIMTKSDHFSHHAPHLARWGPPISDKCLVCKEPRVPGIGFRRGLCSAHYQQDRKRRH